MNSLLDQLAVGVLLATSLGYAVMKLGPRALRQQIQQAVGRTLAAAPAVFGLQRLAQRISAAALQKSKGACGGCDSCASTPTTPGAQRDSPAEVSVPIAKIGRRSEPRERA